jgi:hypothetical protein
MMRQTKIRSEIRAPPTSEGIPRYSTQYEGETKMAAISQNFFVGWIAARPFSKYAAG